MQISAQRAIELGFVCDRDNKKIKIDHSNKSSVDLTIREIIFKNKKGKIKSSSHTTLNPQDSVVVISEEVLHIPDGFVAYVFLKNRLSQKGFLALNTGIIDSNYHGPISTLLINFSAEDSCLPLTGSLDDKVFFRVVFHEIDKNVECNSMQFPCKEYDVNKKYDTYRNYRVKDLEKFPKTFLEPIVLKEQIKNELTKNLTSISFTKFGLLITFIGVLFAMITFIRESMLINTYDLNEFNRYKIESELKIENLEKKVNELQSKNNISIESN